MKIKFTAHAKKISVRKNTVNVSKWVLNVINTADVKIVAIKKKFNNQILKILTIKRKNL